MVLIEHYASWVEREWSWASYYRPNTQRRLGEASNPAETYQADLRTSFYFFVYHALESLFYLIYRAPGFYELLLTFINLISCTAQVRGFSRICHIFYFQLSSCILNNSLLERDLLPSVPIIIIDYTTSLDTVGTALFSSMGFFSNPLASDSSVLFIASAWTCAEYLALS